MSRNSNVMLDHHRRRIEYYMRGELLIAKLMEFKY